ncbi:metal-dependent hydrolase [Mycolicibacterium duvalii]|uniref:Metal-dependent hydrolase n=1 Tax=Mycolicibacterium duvalii TaxID=39688 RepID=A0A7I7K5R8_9MYCO|nr:metal-dependent hydrolase [Mycolicibacterium duvalii]MCV7367668.1 metal-dependent hydrolase [Mycolicibacterium duvalii]PEG35104.1 metal-dependent hydrolase [Mycolicibacterium duvalii]BBX18742.1 metal-dependent hydrolase [Mycolicibacterium duvalii]
MPEVQLHHDGHPAYRRQVRFDWSSLPRHWVPDDPFTSHMINVLHLLLPEGERHFIKAVLEASSLVDDPELEAAIKPFIQQESWHAWAHQVVLDRLAEQGIDTAPYTDRLGRTLSVMLGDPPKFFPPALKRWWLYRRLADVASLEHFTAVLGQWVLENKGLENAGADPMMLDLLRWHGAEEVEHRSLVYDVYQNVSGSYLIRAFSMVMTAPLFVAWWIAGAKYLMSRDDTIDMKWRWRDWHRAAKKDLLPGPWNFLVTVPLRYLRFNHHPGPEADTQMALDYLKYSPAARDARERAEAHEREKAARAAHV